MYEFCVKYVFIYIYNVFTDINYFKNAYYGYIKKLNIR